MVPKMLASVLKLTWSVGRSEAFAPLITPMALANSNGSAVAQIQPNAVVVMPFWKLGRFC